MKAISIICETLRNGQVRITGRRNNSTAAWKDVDPSAAKQGLLDVMNKTAGEHQLRNGSYDMTHIELNFEAQEILTPHS